MIDMTKKYRTRDGREAVILTVLTKTANAYPIVGYVTSPAGRREGA